MDSPYRLYNPSRPAHFVPLFLKNENICNRLFSPHKPFSPFVRVVSFYFLHFLICCECRVRRIQVYKIKT